MAKATLKFLKIPNYTLPEIKQRRLEDWHEDGKYLLKLFEKYRENYHQKICVNCTNEQKK